MSYPLARYAKSSMTSTIARTGREVLEYPAGDTNEIWWPSADNRSRSRHLIGKGLVWFFNPNERSVRSRKCSCFSFVIPPIGIDRVLQHGERDSVGNRKAPPNSTLFSRRNTALVEVTDSDRDADDNRSILFLGWSISFDPKAVISRIVHT